MSTYTLVLVDTTGIQSYIFGSNRLRENVGASHLVHLATEGWLRADPTSLLGTTRHNLRDQTIIDTLTIEGGLDAELLYAGGGNTVLIFRDEVFAKQFLHNLSHKLIETAPGLDVVAVFQPVEWNTPLARALQEGFETLQKRKADRERSHPLLGLGVTASCQSTGYVANFEEAEPGESSRHLLISSEVKAKWLNNVPAKQRLRQQLDGVTPSGFGYPSDFDNLGRSKGDFSYIAVVHADGNGMGKLLRGFIEKYLSLDGQENNRALILDLRRFSEAVDNSGRIALKEVVRHVSEWDERGWLEPHFGFDEELQQRVQQLSIRPIVFGGDDVTFVCDGRIGLNTAQLFLEAFSKQKIPTAQNDKQLGIAAAGISIVKTHYPFARAYELSEALCKNAKKAFDRKCSAMDWHLAQSGLFGELQEIRLREYAEKRNEEGKITESLLMRPITVHDKSMITWQTWDNFVSLHEHFRDTENWPRNKVMQLREALRYGPDAVGTFVTNYTALPSINKTDPQHVKTGTLSGRTVYFDAIEMIEQEVWQ